MLEYGQFCPVAKTAEILGEKWTLLIVRELLLGATRFNQIQRAMTKFHPPYSINNCRPCNSMACSCARGFPTRKSMNIN